MIRIRAISIDDRSWQPKAGFERFVSIGCPLGEHLDRNTLLLTTSCGAKAWQASGGGGWFFPAPAEGWRDPTNFSADLRDANRDASRQLSSPDDRHRSAASPPSGVSAFIRSRHQWATGDLPPALCSAYESRTLLQR